MSRKPRFSLIDWLFLGSLVVASCAPAATAETSATSSPDETPSLVESPLPTETPLPYQQEFQGENQETVTVELPWQGYAVTFEKHKFFGSDPFDPSITYDRSLLDKPDEENKALEYIKPLIYLTAVNSNGQIVQHFDPPLILNIRYSKETLGEDADPDKIKILVYDHNKQHWKKYPPKITLVGDNQWLATISIKDWTSHTCYGR